MLRSKLLLLCFLVAGTAGSAQELFPNSEPASIIPRRAIGLRLMNEAYNNAGNARVWNGAMLMYGISSRFMISAMMTGSNHHGRELGENFILRESETVVHLHPNPAETRYPYLMESLGLGFRYRFLNLDADHRHFRMSVYGNGTYANRPHDEAEVTSMGDNKGLAGGLISTLLVNKLAVSLTAGATRPFAYAEGKRDLKLQYGYAYNYSLSFGYLVYPRKYKNFEQTNINLYAEFLGKRYADLKVLYGDRSVSTAGHAGFAGGNYVEIRPALQFIVKSNLRIDLATALPLIAKSYIRKYPTYQVNIQYYFFR